MDPPDMDGESPIFWPFLWPKWDHQTSMDFVLMHAIGSPTKPRLKSMSPIGWCWRFLTSWHLTPQFCSLFPSPVSILGILSSSFDAHTPSSCFIMLHRTWSYFYLFCSVHKPFWLNQTKALKGFFAFPSRGSSPDAVIGKPHISKVKSGMVDAAAERLNRWIGGHHRRSKMLMNSATNVSGDLSLTILYGGLSGCLIMFNQHGWCYHGEWNRFFRWSGMN